MKFEVKMRDSRQSPPALPFTVHSTDPKSKRLPLQYLNLPFHRKNSCQNSRFIDIFQEFMIISVNRVKKQ